MMLILPLLVVLSLFGDVLSDIVISSPAAGMTYSASDGTANVPLAWVDDGSGSDAFAMTAVLSYTIKICTGLNGDIQCFGTLASSISGSTSSYAASIENTAGPNGYYYLQVTGIYPTGYTMHYSNRFELTGMAGAEGTLVVTDTESPPAAATSITAGANAGGAIDSAWFTIPYTLQTGRTRYAPMQTQPGTAITATTWSRRFPTSAVTYYSTMQKSPNVYSTITPGWSYTMSSLVNWATPAAFPTSYYPANERVTPASLDSDSKRKKKRWED